MSTVRRHTWLTDANKKQRLPACLPAGDVSFDLPLSEAMSTGLDGDGDGHMVSGHRSPMVIVRSS